MQWVLGKRMVMGLNAGLAVCLAGLLAVLINVISDQHRWRLDFSHGQYYTLSPQTHRLLERLSREIQVVVFVSSEHELYREIRQLLGEYQYASRRLRVEYVDPYRNLARSKELALRYDLTEPNVIVFAAAGRRKIVPVKDLADYDYTPLLAERPKIMTAFRGEQVFSSAIASLLQTKLSVVYFLTGHGEHQLDLYDQYTGYSILVRLLRRENLEVKSLNLAEAGGLPGDCDALVIAGPTRRLPRIETEIIKTYLNNRGRVFLLADAGHDTGLDALLETWGLRLGADRVVGLTLTGRELLVTRYGDHPITAALRNVTSIFNLPRSVQPLLATNQPAVKTADKPRVTVLASGPAKGWAEMNMHQNPPVFDAGIDRSGAMPVAVAVEQGPAQEMEMEIKPTRLVVSGDSTFVANEALMAGYGADFFVNALNWLLDRDSGLNIPSKVPAAVRLTLDRVRLQAVYGLLVAGLPALIALAGVLVWLCRRK